MGERWVSGDGRRYAHHCHTCVHGSRAQRRACCMGVVHTASHPGAQPSWLQEGGDPRPGVTEGKGEVLSSTNPSKIVPQPECQ